jgi:hypothetical protein
MVPGMLEDKYVIRFCVNAKNANDDDMFVAWNLIRSHADTILKQFEQENPFSKEETTDLPNQISSEMRRLRFSVSKMVSDPRIYNQKKYKRTATTFRFTSDSGKYLARKCSIVEKSEDEIDE